VIKTKVSVGHCEQFEQKCQVSLELVFRYSAGSSGDDQSYAACSIIPVEISGYIRPEVCRSVSAN